MKQPKEPGSGAIEFAEQFVAGLTKDEARPVIDRLLRGQLHDTADKRIKRCNYCGYYWRDGSLRNTRKTCSDDCKKGIKTLQRRQQRADKELLNPRPRKRTLSDDYVYWLEYSFWLNEYSMREIVRKHTPPVKLSIMDYIMTKNSVYGKGNRKKPKHEIDSF